MSQQLNSGSCDGHNDDSVHVLNEKYPRVEIGNVDVHGGKVVHAQLVHHFGVDSKNFMAFTFLVVNTGFHVIEQNFFGVTM